jgi:hypothetical protein
MEKECEVFQTSVLENLTKAFDAVPGKCVWFFQTSVQEIRDKALDELGGW